MKQALLPCVSTHPRLRFVYHEKLKGEKERLLVLPESGARLKSFVGKTRAKPGRGGRPISWHWSPRCTNHLTCNQLIPHVCLSLETERLSYCEGTEPYCLHPITQPQGTLDP